MAVKRTPVRRPKPAGPVPRRRPEVVLDVECDRGRAHLVLANVGDAAATDISVRFSRPLDGLGGSACISDLPVFSGLGLIRPGREFRVFWDATPRLLARGRETRLRGDGRLV